jgi:hypothetical protein
MFHKLLLLVGRQSLNGFHDVLLCLSDDYYVKQRQL